jgi:hypothetical protein
VSGEVIQTGKTVAVADAAADQRVRQPALRAGGIGPARFAPLAVRRSVLGTLLVANASGSPRSSTMGSSRPCSRPALACRARPCWPATLTCSGAVEELDRVVSDLRNYIRHAQATTCRVSLYEDAGTVVLEVDDDGRGFHPANVRPGGQGLGNLRERALAIGGRVEVDSHPGEGTPVRVELPRP